MWTYVEEESGGRRKLQNKELHNLYASPNIIMEIKSRMMKWVAGDEKSVQFLDLGVDGRIILNLIFKK
jgi:hypothetical protein